MRFFAGSLIKACLLAGLAIFKASPVFAQIQVPTCTATVDDLDFGTIDSGDLPKTVDGIVRMTCSGEPGREVVICASIGDGTSGTEAPEHLLRRLLPFRTSGSRTAPLLYNLLRSNGAVWGTNAFDQQIEAPSLQIRSRLDAQGNGVIDTLIRARIDDLSEVPPGAYRSEFSGDSALFLYRYPLGDPAEFGDSCSPFSFVRNSTPETSAQFTVSATVAYPPPGFTKAFSPDTVALGTLSRLTYTIDNSRNPVGLDFQFLDDFPLGLAPAPIPNVSTTCGGTFVFDPITGTSGVRFSGGRVAAGQTCTLSLDVQGRRFTNGVIESVSGELTSDLAAPAPGASATLTITAAPLSVLMAFSPARITAGGVSRLTYRLRNDAAVPAVQTFLRDVLPAGVVVAAQPNAETTCPNFNFIAGAGNDEIILAASIDQSGLSRIIGECTASVDVTSAVPGSYPNATEFITSSSHGNSPPASATLTVVDAPVFSKAFSPATIDQGEVSTLTFTIDNGANPIDLGPLAFTDNFPDGMIVATPPNATTTCGGTFAPGASDVSLAFTGGAVAVGASCTVSVDVQALRSGTLENISGELTSNLPDAPAATATLMVDAADAPVFSKEFSPPAVDPGRVSTLTFTIDNGANLIDVGSLAFTDAFPDGIAVADTPAVNNDCGGGTFAPGASDVSLSFAGGAVAAGAICTISVDVQAVGLAGAQRNVSGALTSDLPVSTPGAEATLTINEVPLLATMAFDPPEIDPGEISTLTYTLENRTGIEGAAPISLLDMLPADVVVADVPDARTTCGGGTLTADPPDPIETASIVYSGGSLAADSTCAISVDVTSSVAGSYPNATEELTSALGVSTPASATLTVDEAPLIVSMGFSPSTIAQGGVSRLSYELNNGAAVGATSISLSDTLPADVTVADVPDAATTCGGTVTAAAGGDTVAFTGGAVAAGDACAISVDVTSAVAGSYSNGPEAVTSSLGASTPVQATLTVDAADAPVFSKEFSPAAVDPGRVSTLTFTIDNGANLIDVGSLAFTDAFPDGIAVADTPAVNNDCGGGTFAPGASDVSLAFTGGAVAAGASCTVSVDVQAVGLAGAQRNVSGALTSDLPVSTPGAEATLTINEVPLLATMAFDPPEIDPGEISTLTYTLENRTGIEGAAPISLLDMLPADVVVADVPDARTTCGGGTLTADPPDPIETASIVYSGGSLAADSTCAISVDVTSSVAGSYPNATEELTSALGVSTPASATLTVDEAPLIVSMGFSPSTIAQGGVSRLSYELNNGAAVGATSISLSDTLPADVTVADVPDAATTCGGTVTAAAGGDTVAFTGGAVAAGDACAISVDVTSAVAGSYSNGPEAVTSSLGASTPVQATLTVDAADAPVFSKEFSPAAVDPGRVSTLTFTIDNGANLIDVGSLAFTDAFPDGIAVADTPAVNNDCGGGTFAPGASDVSLAFTGGAVAAGASCTVSVDVQAVGLAGAQRNVSGALTSDLPVSTPGAEATLTINEVPLLATMAFDPPEIDPGEISTLTYTLENRTGIEGAAPISLLDMLPADVVVADVPDARTTCGGGTLTADPPDPIETASIVYSGGSLAADSTCAISVDVTSSVAGSYPNATEELTSALGVSTPASATLTVDEAPLIVSMGFSPSTIAQGGVSRLSYELNNGAAVGATSISLSDTLPADVTVADVPDAATTCGGTVTAAAGGDTVAFTGGAVAAGDACAISVDVTSAVAGSYSNGPEAVTSSLGASTPVQATLTVDAADAPVFSKEFSPAAVDPGRVSTLTFTIDNGANLIDVGSLAFTDAFPDGIAVADTPAVNNDCGGGTFAPGASDVSLAFTGGAVAAGASCTVSVDVQAVGLAGAQRNVSGALTSDLPVSTPGAEATLTINEVPLLATMAFDPPEIDPGEISTLTYTLENRTGIEGAAPISLLDMLPADVVVADVPDARTTCGGGTLTADPPDPIETASIVYSGGSLAADSTCAISVDVTSSVAGSYPNATEELTSALGVSTPASATLTVDEAPLIVSMEFSPDTIAQGGVSRLSYELNNGAAVGATSISLSDTLPADVVVADVPDARTTCGGTFAPGASDVSLAFTGGAVAAGVSCTISVDVTSAVAGSYSNGPETVTSSLGDSTAASATLTVDAADAPVFTKAFSPDTIAPGGISRLTFTIDNGANAVEAADLAFTDAFPAGLVVAGTPNGSTTCGGTFAPAASDVSLAFTGGAVAAGDACAISVDVQALRSGTLENISGELTSDLPDAAPAATATLTVDEAPLVVSMEFSPDTIAQGGVSRLSYELNNGAAVGATSISLSDTLPADVVVADAPNAATTCAGGVLTAPAGGDTLAFTGGAVAAGVSCTISVDVTSAVAGSYLNGPETVTSSLGDSTAASATLTVDAADAPVFTKAFSPDTIAPGGISRLTFTIDNGANAVEAADLAFTDAFPAGLVVAGTPNGSTTCGGTFAPAASDVSLAFTGGAVAAGDACAISVDVQALRSGTLENISGALTSDLPDAAPAATATLTINEVPLIVSMGFSPSTIAQGGVSRLSYELNNGAAVGATSISLSDTLPADVTVADAPNAATTCAGGVLTAPAGGDTIAFADGELAAGDTCAISVDVTSAVAGSYSNGPETVTSSLGDSTAASATLTVDAADAPVFTKAFSPDTIAPGGISRLTFTIDNGANAVEAADLAFTDAFPAGLAVADTPDVDNDCGGGTLTAAAGGDTLAFAGGAVAAGASCTISVDVTSAVAGSYPNTSGALTSDLPDAPAATATLRVDEAPLIVSMGFSPSTIAQGGVSRLSYELNNGAAVGATSISLSDTLPADVTVADVPDARTTCAGGVLTAPAGGDTLAFTGGAVAAGVSCTISVDVTSAVAGSYSNGPETVTSSLGDSTAASATLTVDAADAPVFTKAFSPDTIAPGGISRLTFTIDNGANAVEAADLAFTDAFPAGLVVAGTPNGSTTCGGTFAPAASDVSLAFTGGAVAAGASCTISVDVTSAVAGSYPNTSGALTSDLPDAPAATATLRVDEAPLIVSMGFSPSTIAQGGVSRLSYELNNGAAVGATSISLSDTLPADVTVADAPNAATTCAGGVLTAPAGGDTLAFTGGAVAAGVSCTISVDVTSAVAGSYLNGPETVTSSLGDSTAASATLTVDAADAPVFTKAFSPDTIAPGGISRLTFTIDNGANAVEAADLAFTDAFPAGLVVAGTPNGSTTCGGTFAPAASDVSLAFTGGAVAAGDACAISVDVQALRSGTLENISGALTSDLPDAAPAATATLTINEVPLIVSMEFSPDTIAQGGVSRLSYELNNGAAVGATSISLSDTLPADVVVADVPDARTTCGGTFAPGASDVSLAFTGGAVAAGVSCTISVDVTSAVAGSYSNGPEAVTSSLGDSTAASATLTVDAADAPVFTKAFSPDTIAPGGISRLTFTIDNGANAVEAADLAFTDAFPAGLVVAGTPNGSTTCGGTFAPAASDVSLAFTGGAVAAGDACAISVDVHALRSGTLENISGELTSDLPDAAPAATATLTVDEAPLVVSMEFSPDTIAQGGVSRLSYELNNGAAVGATSISLSDTLPADVVVADAPNAATTCGGGVLTAPAGGDTLAFADGALGAGATCTLIVDVTSAVAGSYSNGPETVTSSLGDSTAASATLTVDAADAPVFTKAFSPDTIAPGGISRLTFTIDNGANAVEAADLAFTDAFPAGLVVAGTPNGSTTCGGTFAPAASDVSLAFTGGAVAAGDACAISVDVQALRSGTLENISGALTSDLPDAAPAATATLTINEVPLIVSMEFSPDTIAQGGVSRLSYELNNGAAVGATSISLSDTLPADVTVADAPNAATTCGGGVLTAPAGGDTIAFADGELAAGDTCAISVDVTSAVAGSYSNGPETVTSSLGDSTAASATLTVDAADAPVFTKAFSPDTIAPGGISRLTFTIDNGANAVEAADLAFTDAFPAGLAVADTPDVDNDCGGGTLTAAAGGDTLAFAGGAVAAGASCTISVDVTSAVAGSYPNTSGALTSDLPDAPAATATLRVDEAPLIVSMGFSPSTIAQGGVSRLSYELNNGAAVGATSISLSDTLPADVTVADVPDARTTCAGGVLTAPAGGDTLAFTGGAVAAGVSCTISVDVTSAVAGSYLNGPETVTSSLGDSTAASATLTVDAADAPVFTKAFSPDTIAPGGISRLTFTIDNGANAVEAADLAFTDAFPAGLVVAGTPNGSTTCGGTFAPAASDVSLAFTGGAVAAGASCTISVDVTSAVAGSYPNTSGALTSDLPDAPAATATLRVDEAPLIVSMGFSPSTIAQGGVSRLSYELNNGAAVGATSISLSDTLPADVTVADAPNAATTCAGGVLTAPAGGDTLAFTGGAVAAGVSCTISVDVTSAVAGSYLNGPETVTSSLGDSTAASATLTVDAADAPVFTKAFSPDTIAPGGISRLTFTIDNGANAVEAADLAFTDAFPAGLVVAGTPNGSTTCGGTFAPAASDVSLAFTGGAVAAGDACAISVDVHALRSGTLENISGALTSDLPDAAPAATATLTINEVPLIVSMEFSPDTIAQGGVSRLSYELNNGAAVGATSISLSDTLPADVVVADVPDARTTCGGTFAPGASDVSLAFTGGAVAAGVSCTISVDVTSAVAGSYSNGPETVTSSLGDSTAASATLTVTAADAPVFTKAFSPDTIAPGGISRLTFTIDNGANAVEAADLAFTDAFPAGLVVAGTPNGSTTCGGTFAPAASDVSLAFTGGAVAAGDACAISVDVQALRSGTLENISGALTSDLPDAAPAATATLTVDEAPLVVSMGFSPDTIAQGGVSRLSYELNNGAAVGATSISLSDTLPADVVVADAPNAATTCAGGVLTAPAGGDTLAFADGALGAGATCTLIVDVTSAVAGSYSNGPETVTSSLGDSTAASATLTVDAADAPVFTKAFSPDTIAPGGISRLTFTIDNGANAVEAADLAFTDAFPAGLVVAGTPNGSTTCGGTFAPAASDVSLAFTGGAVAAGDACAISVDVHALRSGTLENISGELTSDLPDAAPAATATLTVDEAPLVVSMEFSPDTIAQGGVSRLSYELNNGAAVGATSISLSDTLPADVVVADAPNAATTCAGGVLTAPAGGDTLAFTGGAVAAAGGACAISVDVTSAVAGSYSNGPETVTSSLGASTPVQATLTVDPAVVPAFAGTVTFDVTSDTDGAFGFSSAEPGLTTSLEISGGTGSTGALPVATAGSYSVAVTPPAGARLTAIACDDTDSTADVSAATVSVTVDASEDVTCTITARSPVEETVETINRFLTRRADLILSSEPDPSRRFDRLKRGSGNAGPVSFSNDDLKALLPFTIRGGNGDYGFSTSLPQARRAVASAALALGPDGDIAYVENHRFDAWFEAQYKEFDAGADRRGDFGIAYAGVDYLLTPDVLVGALVSFDTMEETTDTGTVSGDGWMAGPYMTARLAPSLYFDGRLAAGESDNRISPFGVYTDEFPTGRWLSMASLTGEFQRGDWTIRPHASLSYLEERQKSYVDGVGATIPGRTVRLGQFKIGPAFTGRFEGAEGRIYSPYLKVDAIYNVGDTTGATPAEANDAEVEGWRARVKAGVSMTTEHGTRLSLGATHDGIGRSDFETWGLTFELSVPIGKPKAR